MMLALTISAGQTRSANPTEPMVGSTTENAKSNSHDGSHEYDENGFCTLCDKYQPATQNGEGIYEIANAGQLFWFAALVNGDNTHAEIDSPDRTASAVLTADINIPEGMTWTSIGNEITSYKGTFDGAGHTIDNMVTDDNTNGLVYYLFYGIIKNLKLGENCAVTGFYAGGICTQNSGTIQNCTYAGTVHGNNSAGGICGNNNTGTIENCYTTGTVTSETYAGGICGTNDIGTIENCYTTGTVTGEKYAGGICGKNFTNGTVENCYSTCTVTGSSADGIESSTGGICGINNDGTNIAITNCYWLEGTCSTGIGNGNGEATSKTTEQFASGEVAYLLQNGQTTQAWGQTLGTDSHPVLTTDEASKVYAYSIYNGSDAAETGYANNGASIGLEGNAVAVVETAGFTAADGNDNVIVKNSDDIYTCNKFVLTDGADFYSPVTFTATEATYSRTLPETSTWGTIVLPFEATTTDATLYEATEIVADGGEESLLGVTATDNNTLKANTPALLKATDPGTTVSFSATDATVEATTTTSPIEKAIGESGYSLTGTMKAISALTQGSYFIGADKFWSVGSQTPVGMKAFRACISAPAASGVMPSSMRIVVGGLTGIDHVGTPADTPVDVYTTDGRQLRRGISLSNALNGLPHGIYIVGGKKVSK